jgi:UDP-N-acetyl-D-glucosamine dehydrogenase
LVSEKALNGSKVLIIGMAYKKNVDDMRESPSLVLTELLEAEGAKVSYHDPYVTVIPPTRQHNDLAGRESLELTPETISETDAVLISTNHDGLDYQMMADNATLIIDTRNAMKDFPGKAKVVKA